MANIEVSASRVPLGVCITKGNCSTNSYHIINRRYDPDIIVPYTVSPSDIASCVSYNELSDKLYSKYGMTSSINRNGDIEFR